MDRDGLERDDANGPFNVWQESVSQSTGCEAGEEEEEEEEEEDTDLAGR